MSIDKKTGLIVGVPEIFTPRADVGPRWLNGLTNDTNIAAMNARPRLVSSSAV